MLHLNGDVFCLCCWRAACCWVLHLRLLAHHQRSAFLTVCSNGNQEGGLSSQQRARSVEKENAKQVLGRRTGFVVICCQSLTARTPKLCRSRFRMSFAFTSALPVRSSSQSRTGGDSLPPSLSLPPPLRFLSHLIAFFALFFAVVGRQGEPWRVGFIAAQRHPVGAPPPAQRPWPLLTFPRSCLARVRTSVPPSTISTSASVPQSRVRPQLLLHIHIPRLRPHLQLRLRSWAAACGVVLPSALRAEPFCDPRAFQHVE